MSVLILTPNIDTMSGALTLLPAVLLATIFVFACLLAFRVVFKALWFYEMMRKVAVKLTLRYYQPLISRPPVLCGVYGGREVVIDFVDFYVGFTRIEVTRVRVFHNGTLAQEFSVGDLPLLKRIGKDAGCRRLGSDDDEFERRYVVAGGDLAVIRKYLDAGLRQMILAWNQPYTVGAFDVSYSRPGRITDVKTLSEALDFLVKAAARADKIV